LQGAPPAAAQETPLDLVYILVVLAFFGAAIAYTNACDRL
jgi:hypothetical protein